MSYSKYVIRLVGRGRQAAIDLVKQAPEGWTVQVRPPNRTTQQNARYWHLVAAGAQHLGCSKPALHEYLKRELLGIERIELPGNRFAEVTKSTAALSSAEFTEYMEQVEAWLLTEAEVPADAILDRERW